MEDDNKKLAHAIKIKFGTAPNEPNDFQLDQIKSDLKKIVDAGRTPTEGEWIVIVHRHCNGAGQYKYAGIDNSDITSLLKLVTKPQN